MSPSLWRGRTGRVFLRRSSSLQKFLVNKLLSKNLSSYVSFPLEGEEFNLAEALG